MNNRESDTLRLLTESPPMLEDGLYTVTAKQEVKSPSVESFPDVSADFIVGHEHFTLAADDIYSVYPAPDSSGNYANTLAHIVLSNRSLPWLRREKGFPWLALVCLTDEEIASAQSATISSLFDPLPDGVFFPLEEMPFLACEKADDLCSTIDLKVADFQSLFPLGKELALLTHVKRVDDVVMLAKADEILPLKGDFAVVISNRFVPSQLDSPKKSTVHLVSVEGYADYLADGAKSSELQKHSYVRLVSLYSWRTYSKSDLSPGFREIFTNIKAAPVSPGEGLAARGYLPKAHITRTGEQTVSLYRGPLAPYNVLSDGTSRHNENALTADGHIIYDPELGMMDMSYAAAWQLGRLCTLRNKPVAVEIFNWRRGIKQKRCVQRTKALFNSRLNGVARPEDFERFFFEEICEELSERELVAPAASGRRIAQSEVGE